MILDTGASVSYAPSHLASGQAPLYVTADFHPSQEEYFTTPIHRVPLDLAGRNLAIRAGILGPADLPAASLALFGEPGREWIQRMIRAVIDESERRGEIAMEPEMLAGMHAFRDFMFERVYLRPEARRQAEKVIRVIRDLVDYYLERPDAMPESYRQRQEPLVVQVIDVVAGMTDRYALRVHDDIFRPTRDG